MRSKCDARRCFYRLLRESIDRRGKRDCAKREHAVDDAAGLDRARESGRVRTLGGPDNGEQRDKEGHL